LTGNARRRSSSLVVFNGARRNGEEAGITLKLSPMGKAERRAETSRARLLLQATVADKGKLGADG
jgi:hypothetical protein